MKRITIVCPCFNEEDNVRELYAQVKAALAPVPDLAYDLLYIDNASSDRTVAIIRELAAADPSVRAIVNTRNFGHIRSPFHAMLESDADATILMACDLQDPPEMLPQFVAKWREGFRVVAAVKNASDELPLMYAIRTAYYRLVKRLADVELLENFTGFGLYDRSVIQAMRRLGDPYPYLRGLVSEIGWPVAQVPFRQPRRRKGITKNNFYTLYDMAMLGITNHTKIPLRLATMVGFAMSALSLFVAFCYLVAKLVFWNQFALGTAPVVVGLFLFASVQLFFIGILGEYIGAIHVQSQDRPHVFERERINFGAPPEPPRVATQAPPAPAAPPAAGT